MRATKVRGPVFDMTLNKREQRFFEAQAKRLGISIEQAIALSAELAHEADLQLPEKPGQILPFEALKSAQAGRN